MADSAFQKRDQVFGDCVNADVWTEKMFHRFLGKHFYWRIPYFLARRSIDDNILQPKGVDLLLDYGKPDNHRILRIDEKVDAHFLNTTLDTFVLELLRPPNKQERDLPNPLPYNRGWILDTSLLTDVYVFIWGFLDRSKYPFVRGRNKTPYSGSFILEEDVKAAVVLFIKKKDILDYLLSLGLSLDDYYYQAEVLRKVAELHKQDIPLLRNKQAAFYLPRFESEWQSTKGSPFWKVHSPSSPDSSYFYVHHKAFTDNQISGVRMFTCSGGLRELPVNIVLEREMLLKLAFVTCYVRDNMLLYFPKITHPTFMEQFNLMYDNVRYFHDHPNVPNPYAFDTSKLSSEDFESIFTDEIFPLFNKFSKAYSFL